MSRRAVFAMSLACVFIGWSLSAHLARADKIKVTREEDLPRHEYKIEGKAVDFLDDDAAVARLAGELKKDMEDDLAKYDIQDKSTLQRYYAGLGVISLLEKRYDDYLATVEKRKELEEKESQRLMMGLVFRAYIAAQKEAGDSLARAFGPELKRELDALPYDKVAEEVKSSKAMMETLSRELMMGGINAGVQPILDKSGGTLSRSPALGLLNAVLTLRYVLPLKDQMVADYEAWLNEHNTVKPDIWPEREIALTPDTPGKPVVLAIWDSGVDTDIFARSSQLWTNPKEKPDNAKDDDKNGFVDDVHGIAWSLHADKEIPLLFDLGNAAVDRPRLEAQVKGLVDLGANLDTPEAKRIKEVLSTLPRDSVTSFVESIEEYSNYCHGTHVAGIAVRGNPFARILVARETVDYHMIPETPTEELSQKSARSMQETIAYFKRNGARVVNMSWGGNLKEIEHALEVNHAGGEAEQRKALALKLFHIERDALYDAIKGAPDILFVAGAGNENTDNAFEEFFPASFDLPNVLTAGAVDQAGDETGFTSFGKTDVYSDGYEVASFVPGGDELKLSGTSMAAPNVVNLAGKLLAVRGDLTVARLRDLILRGADTKMAGQREVRLINPKKSMELLAELK